MQSDYGSLHAQLSGTNANLTRYAQNGNTIPVKVTGIELVPNTAVATDGTNYITTTISIGGVTIATHTTNTTGGSAMVAGTPLVLDFASTGVGQALELAASGVVSVAVVKSGTGPAFDFSATIKTTSRRV